MNSVLKIRVFKVVMTVLAVVEHFREEVANRFKKLEVAHRASYEFFEKPHVQLCWCF